MKYHHDRLSGLSSRFLAELEEVRELELERRSEPISTPGFHGIAREVEARSARLLALARAEESVGEELMTQDLTIDDYERARPRVPLRPSSPSPVETSEADARS